MSQPTLERYQIKINGAVQGLGFRPFIYRLANEHQLTGWILNSPQGVVIEAEGSSYELEQFYQRLLIEKPHHAIIHTIEKQSIPIQQDTTFTIRHSETRGGKTALLLPDIATCSDCRREIFDPQNRRYLYPFTNCTNCGPRFTIIRDLPYDRSHTSMRDFTMCPECQREYVDPRDRRFHAQPNACPLCGPHLEFWTISGESIAQKHEALLMAAEAIKHGKIIAIKGLGGFHLFVDAQNQKAISRLRERKHRYDKPLGLMFLSVEQVGEYCHLTPKEEHILTSPEAPIVLVHRTTQQDLPSNIAPGNPYLGCMLPYTPLHHILMRELAFPVVATSANLSEEPICIDEHEALKRLADIADGYLVHNRPIVRHADDSVVAVLEEDIYMHRRARGYAPLPIRGANSLPPMLAVGGHLKNTVALSQGQNIFISQHIGDLETEASYNAFTEVIESLQRMYELKPDTVVSDLHPDYLSTQYACQTGLPHVQVQHHHAHTAACMFEHHLQEDVLAVSWDGTGYGLDHTLWGGEFFTGNPARFQRFATFRSFPMPSGEKAIKEPRRIALGLLYACFGEELFRKKNLPILKTFQPEELALLHSMLKKNLQCPQVCSVGRLFDAVASLIGIRQHVAFEGQAAMELEFAIRKSPQNKYDSYKVTIEEASSCYRIDWAAMVEEIIEESKRGKSVAQIAARFHNTLVEMIVRMAQLAKRNKVILTGGCFQNRYLTLCAMQRLREEGFEPYRHHRVPPNDGGISLGQAVIAYYRSENPCV